MKNHLTMSLRTFLTAALALVLLVPSQTSAAPLEAALEKGLAEERLAGISWSVVNGASTFTGASGKRNASAGAAMAPGDRIHIGSVTKTLIAVGLLRLASQGVLDLDAPVTTILPNVRFDNSWERTNPVRVRHLLDHTAGLQDLRVWQMFSGRVGPDDPLGEAFRRSPSVLKVRTRPGEMFSYSNVGYALAGMIIERVTGQRYERWLDANLLAPLGMKDSTFAFVSQRADPRLAWGHNDDLSLAAALPVALRPASQFTTTAADMALFARFLMGDGATRGKPFIRGEWLRAMGVPTDTAAARAGLRPGYRSGLALRDRQNHLGRCHGGNIVGYRAMLCIYPEHQKAFFYSIDTDGESADYARFDRAMMEALSLPRLNAAPAGAPAADVSRWDGRYVPRVSGIGLERYSDLLGEGLSIEAHAQGVMVRADGGDARLFAYAGGHRLRAPDRTLPSHVLLQAADGQRMVSDGLRTFVRIKSGLIWALWGSLGLGLLGLVYLTLVLPIVSWRRRRSILQPAAAAPLLLLGGAGLMALQPFEQLGDPTVGSILLFAGSLGLPLGAAVQGALALSRRPLWWKPDLIAAAAVVQWAAVLAGFGLLPLALWL